MRDTWTYSVDQVSAFFGVIALAGDATVDGGITITPTTPLWREESGVDGQVIRVRVSRFACQVEVNLPVASQAHAELLRWASVDALTGAGTAPLSVTIPSSGITFNSVAYIDAVPPQTYAGQYTTTTWTFQCPFMTAVSALATPRVQNLIQSALD